MKEQDPEKQNDKQTIPTPGTTLWVEHGQLREASAKPPASGTYEAFHRWDNRAADTRDIYRLTIAQVCGSCARTPRYCRCPTKKPARTRNSSGVSLLQGRVLGTFLWGENFRTAWEMYQAALQAGWRREYMLAEAAVGRIEAMILAEKELSSLTRIAALVSVLEERTVTKNSAHTALRAACQEFGCTRGEIRGVALKSLGDLANCYLTMAMTHSLGSLPKRDKLLDILEGAA